MLRVGPRSGAPNTRSGGDGASAPVRLVTRARSRRPVYLAASRKAQQPFFTRRTETLASAAGVPDRRTAGVPCRLLSCVLLLGSLFCGCAQIDPKPDMAGAHAAIAERTGTSQVYSPSADDLVAERVSALLKDGLTVPEAVEITLLNNPGFQSLFEEIGISRAQVVQSGLLSNPVLSGLVKFPEAGGRVSLDIGFSQELVDLWQIPVRRRIAKAKLEQTIATVSQRAVELAAEAKTNYYRLRTRQMEEESIAASVRIVADSTQIVERQVKNGAASQLDLNLARAASMDVQLELISAQRQRETARIQLGRTLGLAPPQYATQLTDALPHEEAVPDVERLTQHAMSERFDLRRAQQEVTAAEDELLRQSLLIFPSVVAGVGMERPERQALPGRNVLADTARSSIRNGGLTAPEIQTRGQRAQERRQVIDFLMGPSFQVALPIFDQNQAQIAMAASRVRQRRKDLEGLSIQVQSEIEQSLSASRSAAQEVEFYRREAIPIAEANEAGSRTVFTTGAQTILVLLEAQRSLVARRRGYVLVLGDYAAALVELERAVGGRFPSTSTAPAEATHE